MSNVNCWDFQRCGFGPKECKGDDDKICPAASHKHADGFLGGENGGRACYFIADTICGGSPMTPEQKKERCNSCSFFHTLSNKYGETFSKKNFVRYVVNSENRIVF
ncbi:MAG: hypothetical protein HQL70_00585 [Magnetococcales bacterium]|nr:hypothetical protein [Magnetococcales bacterium]